jgi:hypothetical protein
MPTDLIVGVCAGITIKKTVNEKVNYYWQPQASFTHK